MSKAYRLFLVLKPKTVVVLNHVDWSTLRFGGGCPVVVCGAAAEPQTDLLVVISPDRHGPVSHR